MGFKALIQSIAHSQNVSADPRVTRAGELLQMPWVYQMAIEGRVFVAGHGLEQTAVDSEAAADETKPNFSLSAPAGGKLVIPLAMEVYMLTEGGAAPNVEAIYVQEDVSAIGSGTAHTPLNVLGGTDPVGAQAKCQHTLTGLTAFADAQNVMLANRNNILDNYESVEAATTQAGAEGPGRDSFTFKLPLGPVPYILKNGSSLLFYMVTGTSDSTWSHFAAWVELDIDVYNPAS